jgi:hypothetical protein
MEKQVTSSVPQFATAEYSNKADGAACKSCGRAISGAHYRVNGVLACADCAERIKDQVPKDSHAAFARGVSFGVAGAILGFGIYVAFALATGWMVGYISLAIGYIVGKAIMMGSGGRGGRRYQVAAVLLTYMAVSLAAVPIAISLHMKHKSAQQDAPTSATAASPAAASASASASAPKMGFAKAVGMLTLVGLASPFLELADPMHGLIGLIILLVGIRIAWKITAGTQVNIVGPINDAIPATPG